MLTAHIRTSDRRLEIGRGTLRAQFERHGPYWIPSWFWLGSRRMLRFKDHEWLALGHLRPKAVYWEIVEDSAECAGVQFFGHDSWFGIPVDWSVSVATEHPVTGLTITTEIRPAATVELLQCFSRFETPDDYDGREEVFCVFGQTPTVLLSQNGRNRRDSRWRASARTSSRSPLCCLSLRPADGGPGRFLSFLGHWDQCCFRTGCVAPGPLRRGKRSYEIRVGTLDAPSGEARCPGVFLEGGKQYSQRVSIAFSENLPGGTLDRWTFGCFERSLSQSFPKDAVVEVEKRARQKGVSLAAANSCLIEAVGGPGVPGLITPDEGLVNYAAGNHPEAGAFSFRNLAPWLGPLGYQAYVTRQKTLRDICERFAKPVAAALDASPTGRRATDLTPRELLPLLRYVTCFSNDPLERVIQGALSRWLEGASKTRSGGSRGAETRAGAAYAEAFLLAGTAAEDERLITAGLACLESINTAGREYGLGGSGRGAANKSAIIGRLLPHEYAHAIMSNLLAYEHTRDEVYTDMAGVFARYLAALCFAACNDGPAPEFDTRGFADASIHGSSRVTACSPVETSESLRAVAYWLAFCPAQPRTFYDLLYLFSRTFCGVFPAARETHVGVGLDGSPRRVPFAELPAEYGARRFPYVAYEAPVEMVGQSPRAGLEALQNYLTFGGGLASCDNDRLLALVPRAAGYDRQERDGRRVYLYNPTAQTERTRLAIHHLPARGTFDVFADDCCICNGVAGDALHEMEIEVRAAGVATIEVRPAGGLHAPAYSRSKPLACKAFPEHELGISPIDAKR